MRSKPTEGERTIGLAPGSAGFGYTVFEHPYGPIDWGCRYIPGRDHGENIAKMCALIQWSEPRLLVVENFVGYGSRRAPRIQALIRSIALLAKETRIEVRAYSRSQIRQAFVESEARTKHEIASVIAREFRVLAPHLPKRRRQWESEDRRMQMFDSAALVMTDRHFQRVNDA